MNFFEDNSFRDDGEKIHLGIRLLGIFGMQILLTCRISLNTVIPLLIEYAMTGVLQT